MAVEYVTGDLFEVPVRVIGHGVNCHGVMGSGIAPLFRKQWPSMYAAYRAACRFGYLFPGEVFVWPAADGRVIINMATQDAPGANATLDSIREALTKAVKWCDERQVDQFAIPRIGAGIGGLSWPDVQAVVEEVASTARVTIVVVSLPDAD